MISKQYWIKQLSNKPKTKINTLTLVKISRKEYLNLLKTEWAQARLLKTR